MPDCLRPTFVKPPLSVTLVSMMMTPQRRSCTICQKSPVVDSLGPCKQIWNSFMNNFVGLIKLDYDQMISMSSS